MAERRSLGDAITPEKLAFIKGSEMKNSQPVEKVKVIETAIAQAPEPQETKVIEKKPKASRRSAREEEPEAAELLGEILVSLTNRFQHRTVQALKRAHLERKLKNLKPNTQQEIVETAVQDWLREHGYLD